ncbi:MAG: LVIVD repeat-containing protein [Ktedonobacteraceae bacterium]
MSMAHLDVPRRNIDFVSHSEQGGRGDGVQIMVHKGHAYIGHMFSNGITIVNVADPKNPRPVNFLPTPPNTWALHLQTHDDLLLVINAVNLFGSSLYTNEAEYYTKSITETFGQQSRDFSAGMRVYDISRPEQPREIGFMPVEGLGLHRMWYVGGRYAYASALLDGYSDYIFMVVDMADPTHPKEAGRWWLPGMWRAGGETPTWGAGRRYALHHAIVADNIAYASWRDGGLTLLDVSNPSQPRLLAHRNWCPPFGGGTHTSLPLPDRELVIVADEAIADNCTDQVKYTWVVDAREPTNPVMISTFPTPSEEDYCAKGGHFGPHNLHENRPGSFQSSELIFATYQNAGVRVFNIKNPFQPEEVAYLVPPPPQRMFDTRPNRAQVIQSCDVFVDREGLMYVTDYNAGLYILQYKGN